MIYILLSLAVAAVVFLLMIAVQLFRIEKSLTETCESASFAIKKLFVKQ